MVSVLANTAQPGIGAKKWHWCNTRCFCGLGLVYSNKSCTMPPITFQDLPLNIYMVIFGTGIFVFILSLIFCCYFIRATGVCAWLFVLCCPVQGVPRLSPIADKHLPISDQKNQLEWASKAGLSIQKVRKIFLGPTVGSKMAAPHVSNINV
uniref:Uncharacterized protein n=1 Tax=Fundulus heteroclitus TaxID=8078 RepID=A0A3Q2PVD1_FUNHE